MNRRTRTRSLLIAAALVVVSSLLAWVVFGIAQNSRMTAEKLRQYEDSVDIASLSGAERADALRKLAEKINELSLEERRKSRLGPEWKQWFDKMTENEKGQFIEATLPSGFKQWLNVFDNLPEASRKSFIDAAMKQLKTTHQPVFDREPGQDKSMYGTNGAPALSPGLWQRAQSIGLRTFYSESSAEAKAELAPFLEELQHQMQTGKTSK
ncbi:MAG TPA: hypothetical protein VFC07_15035 [Verrucomicrobiae bacterium]|nr:hypothetical protein [Verrucomicrobiae bacterium]